MLGMNLLNELFDQEGEHSRARERHASPDKANLETLADSQYVENRKYWDERDEETRKYQEVQEREAAWEELKDFLKMVMMGLFIVALIVFAIMSSRPASRYISSSAVMLPAKATQNPILTRPQVVYHYNMSREDWQEYQYQQSLKDIDAGVREQRMHNATLAAQRQAVVECRGGIEWLALAVPAAQFVSTGVPCTSNPDQKSKN